MQLALAAQRLAFLAVAEQLHCWGQLHQVLEQLKKVSFETNRLGLEQYPDIMEKYI